MVAASHDSRPLMVFGLRFPGGMVDEGDLLAAVELQAQLGSAVRLVEAGAVTDNELCDDLILIGGNSLTGKVLERLDGVLSLGFAEQGSAVYDRKSGFAASPRFDDAGEPRVDYGLVVRAANPFAPETSEVVVVAGCGSYGTAAAAEAFDQAEALGGYRHFEALVETTVFRGSHRDTFVREARGIA
ncbi:hypothetical protein SAMN05421837_106604 [Amycolatopsis pretoriensis]|uniref:Uncharacterized protein n=1 Tax=Amycolatopsis pretoriensis TaxID=218821 RepID=A0A1H5R692_9PSEU|nr:hypothetical protein [Amycolatopsis pretoriensis]SEF33111.1 hypothetical protein SAMN05421837_106604 [Amycolatopsis pretoriensis]